MDYYRKIVEWLIDEPKECEWVEFKENFHSPDEIGESISALSNGACLAKQRCGYLVFGVDDNSKIVGTNFNPAEAKKGNDPLIHWLAQRIVPRVDFEIHRFLMGGKYVVLFKIPTAKNEPVKFFHTAYIRVGSVTRALGEFPEKERKIWTNEYNVIFTKEIAKGELDEAEIIELLDIQTFFELNNLPYPSNRSAVIDKLQKEKLVIIQDGKFAITNLGGLLFAKDVHEFPNLLQKSVRVIVYDGKSKLKTKRDNTGQKGYAVGFKLLVDHVNNFLPSNEEISKVIRETVSMYPPDAVRELIANAIVHQDFLEKGPGPLIEIYDDRIEITNLGVPLITPLRFIDENETRNERLAYLMRRMGICEEKGSGIDRVIALAENYQLPAPDFRVAAKHTKVTLFAYKQFNDMDKQDRIRACYQHCCLKYVMNDRMTNQTLRDRFKIEDQNAATASRIISDTVEAGLIKLEDPENRSKKFTKYIPQWA